VPMKGTTSSEYQAQTDRRGRGGLLMTHLQAEYYHRQGRR
jgi:hypothetical protein